jgi:glycosyltransferase involved in cell wall biosynthesis
MKILINALSARRGGGQTYLQHLLNNVPEDNEIEIILLSPDSLKLISPKNNVRRLELPAYLIRYPILRTFWEMYALPNILRCLRVNVLFCPGGSVSGNTPPSCKVVTTFQNMLPFDIVQRRKYPFGYMRFRNWALYKKLLSSMSRSDLVIFISDYAKTVIEKELNNTIKQSVIIPHGIDDKFRRKPKIILPVPSWLPNNGYLLYVSIFDVYKSQIEVIEGYALLKRNHNVDFKLVLVGPEYKPYGDKVRETIKSHSLGNHVLIKESIPHNDLPAVYQNATVNIFASQTENCPFILLEALAAGRPLLVSNCPPMPEFGDSAVIYFKPTEPKDLANKLAALLMNPILMNDLSEKALEQSFKYSWNSAAKNTWDSIISLANK